MTVWHGNTTGCLWFYFNGELTKADWKTYMDQMALHTQPEGALTETAMIVSHHSGSPTPTMRREVAEFMRDRKELLAHLKGHAMVTESALTRGSLIALNWVFKKPFPERVFSEPTSALSWLSEISVMAKGDEIWAEIERAVAPEALWPVSS